MRLTLIVLSPLSPFGSASGTSPTRGEGLERVYFGSVRVLPALQNHICDIRAALQGGVPADWNPAFVVAPAYRE